jgi:N-acyl-D-aspartate/D-glutamate deacylase
LPSGLASKAAAERVIDAGGLALMPGIIDSHTHFDAQITWDPTLRPSPALGVTTAVIGNCGFTIAPCRPADREITMRNLTQVEGMSIDALRAGIDWGFETFPEYMAQLRARGSAVNVAAYVGHSSVRTYVMGADAANAPRLRKRSAACRPSSATRWRTARSASPAAPARRTTAKAGCRCRRASPATRRWPRSSAPWARAAAASTC